MSLGWKAFLLWAGLSLLWGQEPPPTPAPPKPAVLFYERRPLRIPILCRAETFEEVGLDCSPDEPCRVLLELTAVEAAGAKILLVGNLHTPSATVSSIALASDDAGTTWHEPLKRLAATGFEAVQLLNEQYGWISVQPQAQFASDPYLLATPDGGSTWQKLPIWTEEGRAGILQQFYFESRDHGFVLIDRSQNEQRDDRYELYETRNAGLSWMLRETSPRAITPKWPARRQSDWRIRVDAKAKTYELERRVGEDWRRMANFHTDLGVCKSLETDKTPRPGPEGAPERPPDGAPDRAPGGVPDGRSAPPPPPAPSSEP